MAGVATETRKASDTLAASAAKNIPKLAPVLFGEAAKVAPIQTKASLEALLSAPEFAAAGLKLNQQTQLGNALNDLSTLVGPGKDVAMAQEEIRRLIDPEYYKQRAGVSGKISELLGGLNPNELSGSEIANIERTQNRNNIATGVAGTGGNLAAIKNAQTFGRALQDKQTHLSNVLGQIGAVLPSLRTGTFDAASATGKASENFGLGQFPSATSAQDKIFGLTSNLLGQASNVGSAQSQIQSQQLSTIEKAAQNVPDY